MKSLDPCYFNLTFLRKLEIGIDFYAFTYFLIACSLYLIGKKNYFVNKMFNIIIPMIDISS